MNRRVKVAILGAGTAGLSAFKEACKQTDDVVLIDGGTLGTTCARVGCMPSKALIHIANQFHERRHLQALGISGADQLTIDIPAAMAHVRSLRDRFSSGVVKYTKSLGKHFIAKHATFINKNSLKVGDEIIQAEKIIISTGSHSIVPDAWQAFRDSVLTTDDFFEQENFASSIAVIGGGVIGLELGQALSRLGIDIHLYHSNQFIGGITDPNVNEVAIDIFRQEFHCEIGERANVINQNGLCVMTSQSQQRVGQILAAAGRAPNIASLNLDVFDLHYNDNGIPIFDPSTMQIHNTPIYLAGDINKSRPLLHEAADEGRIAGFNAVRDCNQCFQRRVPIRVIFSQPNIIGVGKSYAECQQYDIAVGEIDYADQGRSRIMQENQGLLRVYGDKHSGELLGAEGIVPAGEHIAHCLAWAIQQRLSVFDVLQLPFYHPVVEEGMRTALRDCARQIDQEAASFEMAMCDSEAVPTLS